MASSSRRKGFGYEREIVAYFQESGLEAKRAYASNGESLGHHASVDVLASGKRIQAKRRAKIAAWMKPSENQDAVVVREDRGASLVILTLAEYADLLKAAGQPAGEVR